MKYLIRSNTKQVLLKSFSALFVAQKYLYAKEKNTKSLAENTFALNDCKKKFSGKA